MFKNISWTNYEMFILITLAVYYVTIGCLYYMHEIKELFSGNSTLLLKLQNSKKLGSATIQNKTDFIVQEDTNTEDFSASNTRASENGMHSMVNKCMNEVEHLLANAAQQNYLKPELIYSLQQLTGRHTSIQRSPFKSFITNYILIECENYCSIHLNEDELKLIWAN